MKMMNGVTTNSSSSDFKIPGQSGDYVRTNIYVSGTLGGGTLTVEAKLPDGSGYVKVAGGAITEVSMVTLESGPFIGRLTLSGSTGANVNAWVEQDTPSERQRVAL